MSQSIGTFPIILKPRKVLHFLLLVLRLTLMQVYLEFTIWEILASLVLVRLVSHFKSIAIQCLSAVQPLTDFFIGNLHLETINKTNPMGSAGNVTSKFAGLI